MTDMSGVNSCESVTAVGGTLFDNDQPEETGAQFSGGGFSNLFGRPSYQDAAVSAYLRATNNTQTSAFNVSGRAGVFLINFLSMSRVPHATLKCRMSLPSPGLPIFRTAES